MRFLGALLVVVGNRRFVSHYWTTLGRTIWYPTTVDDPYRYVTLIRHECVHVSQWRKWNVLFWLTYLMLPLPIGLAWFRWRWEREAMLVNIRAAYDPAREIERCVNALWREYAWTWPKKRMRKWFLEHV